MKIEKEELKKKILNYFADIYSSDRFKEKLAITNKQDQSLVTKIDLYISDLIKQEFFFQPILHNLTFLSEEDDCLNDWKFPSVILDPIDGTNQLAQAIPECAVSLGVFFNPSLCSPNNWAWIFNPFTGFERTSEQKLSIYQSRFPGKIYGLVSRSEWIEGCFPVMQTDDISLSPRGSIAFKLGLLASGACDFVCSLRPKKVWDIAAGTYLCVQRGMSLFENGREVLSIDQRDFKGPLIWCHREDYEKISHLLSL